MVRFGRRLGPGLRFTHSSDAFKNPYNAVAGIDDPGLKSRVLNGQDDRSRHQALLETPSPDEVGKVGEKIRCGVDDDQSSKVFRARPYDAKKHAAHGERNSRVGNRIEC